MPGLTTWFEIGSGSMHGQQGIRVANGQANACLGIRIGGEHFGRLSGLVAMCKEGLDLAKCGCREMALLHASHWQIQEEKISGTMNS